MLDTNFRRYLNRLSYTEEEVTTGVINDTTFEYRVDTENHLAVKYILTPTNEDIYREHRSLWNMNRDKVFVAVMDQHSHIINVKEKPDAHRPLRNAVCLRTFDYGVNTIGFEDIVPSDLSKQYIDSAFFFDFVIKNQRKGQEVDKDLLLNLLQLKSDLISDRNEEIVHLLILRCIFIKYLEDRGIFEGGYLLDILKSQDPQQLVAAFDEIRKINGDVFKYDNFKVADIQKKYLKQLTLFFETDYRSGLRHLFPYQFDRIPIQLISHVYEAFLKDNSKKRKGIYYTPSLLVEFMLKELFSKDEGANLATARCLDAAVGSGAFLVECFKRIQASFGRPLSFDEKKGILENQLFGIDIDRKALQITAFSLYLALLETEDPGFIRHEIQHAHPILPSLIDRTLKIANAITDDVFKGETFDYIVSNPPWGSVPKEEDAQDEQEAAEIRKERKIIGNKGKGDSIFANVADFERSQAFLVRFREWSGPGTRIATVVKNSIFLNDSAEEFRKDLLSNYQLEKFFELSHYNKILFKKKVIGQVEGKNIELGASEPCVVLICSIKDVVETSIIDYISPKLTPFAEHFDLIQFTERDQFKLKQSMFTDNDLLWKILVNGDVEDFELVLKLKAEGGQDKIICSRGFEPAKNMEVTNEAPRYRTLIKSEDFDRYVIRKRLGTFNWSQKLRRKPEEYLYEGDRILIAYRPSRKDAYRLRAIKVDGDIVFRNDVLCFKIRGETNHDAYLALLNSKLFGYFIFHISSQWDGGLKREALRTYDLKAFDFARFLTDDVLEGLKRLVNKLKAAPHAFQAIEAQIDEFILEKSGLLDYEKEMIREFYQVKVERASNNSTNVNVGDIKRYIGAFDKVFSLIIAEGCHLCFNYHISPNLGATICVRIQDTSPADEPKIDEHLKLLNFVKNKQLQNADALKVLNEGKVKVYEKNYFYIIKSNQFKDWTVRQAIVDAREEVRQFIQQLS
jgi:methylase of polypeptide subunit release factors